MVVQLNCCGADGPIDYRDSSWFNHTHYTDGTFVPPACCVLPKDDTTLVNLNDGIEAAETMCQIDAIAVISNYPNRTFLSSIDHVNAQVTLAIRSMSRQIWRHLVRFEVGIWKRQLDVSAGIHAGV